MMRRNAKSRLWTPLTALNLLLMLTCCDTPGTTIKGAPEPLWPDRCTADWLVNTPHPACVSRWKDLYDRQQGLLEKLQ